MLTIESAYKYISKNWKDSLMFCLWAFIANIIPVFGQILVSGVSLRIISNAIKKKDEIPKVFGNVKSDLLNGLKYCLFTIILAIPFWALVMFFAGGTIAAISLESTSNFQTIMAVMASIFVPSMILGIIYILIVPALIANYAKEGKFSAFFEFKKAYNMVFSKFELYLKMIGIIILYGIIINAIAGFLSFTVVGTPIIMLLSLLAFGNILGTWFSEAEK